MAKQLTFAVIGAFALAVMAFGSAPQRASAPVVIAAATSTVEEIKQDALDVYLSRLAWTYECVGKCALAQKHDLDFKIVDSNGKYSYGCLQFQQDTYLAMAKRYGIDPWAGRGIYDCDNQWKIARAMFEDDPVAAAQHWYTSVYVRGLGIPKI